MRIFRNHAANPPAQTPTMPQPPDGYDWLIELRVNRSDVYLVQAGEPLQRYVNGELVARQYPGFPQVELHRHATGNDPETIIEVARYILAKIEEAHEDHAFREETRIALDAKKQQVAQTLGCKVI